jgi:prepilin-type N-terminal cleavage/methylation domain-containing protein
MKLQPGKKIKDNVKDNKGFTIVELMLTMGIIVIVVSLISAAYFLSADTSKNVVDTTTSEIDSRLIMYRISKDIREAVEISEAESSSTTFKSNVDDDEVYETVRYYLETENGYYTLYRKVDSGNPHIIASKIINDNIFTYYTGIDTPEGGMTSVSGEELASIKIININLSIDQAGAASSRTMELETNIALRNRI